MDLKQFMVFCMGLSLAGPTAKAATVTWYNSVGTELKDLAGVPLYEGPRLGTYDGDLIQLGYYSTATTSDPFSGTWNVLANGTIGDKVNDLPGRYNHTSSLGAADLIVGIPLVIRFYDSPALETATFFNAVSDSTGAWNAVNTPMTLSLLNSIPVWQDGQSSAFRTTVSIPEPSPCAFFVFSCMGVLGSRRWRSIVKSAK